MWNCLQCKEAVDDHFDRCWNCGCDREGNDPENIVDYVPSPAELLTKTSETQRRRLEQMPCPVCHQTEYNWGIVEAEGLEYFDEDAGLLERVFSFGHRLPVRTCQKCGNIQFFASDQLDS